jgi:hypothetical protein
MCCHAIQVREKFEVVEGCLPVAAAIANGAPGAAPMAPAALAATAAAAAAGGAGGGGGAGPSTLVRVFVASMQVSPESVRFVCLLPLRLTHRSMVLC